MYIVELITTRYCKGKCKQAQKWNIWIHGIITMIIKSAQTHSPLQEVTTPMTASFGESIAKEKKKDSVLAL